MVLGEQSFHKLLKIELPDLQSDTLWLFTAILQAFIQKHLNFTKSLLREILIF